MPSMSFDPFADIYDATRGYPADVAARIAQAIAHIAQATTTTRFLEVGIGTGRIALPLATLGHYYTGIDISEKMVEQLEIKLQRNGWLEESLPWGSLPDEDQAYEHIVRRFTLQAPQATMRLAMSDMTNLPFFTGSFDVVIAVHVFHLVEDWQEAVQEVLRVLRPGGLFLHCWDEHGKSDVEDINTQWSKILDELGYTSRTRGTIAREDVGAFLHQQGLQTEQVRLITWERSITPRLVLEHILHRHWSHTRAMPDHIFAIATERLRTWVLDYYGASIDTVHKREQLFVVSKTVSS